MIKNYELIEHTADIGIKIKGKDLRELFINAALAMFDIIAERKNSQGKRREIKIKQKAEDLGELFINWLNELLFFFGKRVNI
jgi:SHS2 domain-containing protein